MSITLDLSPEAESQIREAAAREGQELAQFILEAAHERARLRVAGRLEAARHEWATIVAENQKLGLYDE